MWVSTGCIISIFNVNQTANENSYNLRVKRPIDDDHLICMLGFSGHIWAGSLRGHVYVFRMSDYELHKTFAGHKDSVCSLCSMLGTYVVSGSAVKDTSIAIWDNVQPKVSTSTSATPVVMRPPPSMPPPTIESRISRKADANGDMFKSLDNL